MAGCCFFCPKRYTLSLSEKTDMLFTTSRLVVRHLLESDFPHVFAIRSDPAVMKYIRVPETDPEQVRERMSSWAIYAEKCPGLGVFAVAMKEDGVFTGYVTARHVEFDPASHEYEVGYTFSQAFWGQGIASVVLPALCGYLFDLTDVEQVVAFTHPDNAASQRVLLKYGFQQTGTRMVYGIEGSEFWLRRA